MNTQPYTPPHQTYPAPMSIAGPYRPARSGNTVRILLWITGGLVFLLLGLATLAGLFAMGGPIGFALGVVLATLPMPILIATFMWIDRLEPEPLKHLLFAFAWGGFIATFFGGLLNEAGAHLLGVPAPLVSPFVEETLKGFGVLLFVLFRRKEFDGVVDGIVLGGIVGGGFSFIENIQYYGIQFSKTAEVLGADAGFLATVALFLIRDGMGLFAHSLYTAMTGIGLGVSVTTRNPALKVLAPVGGWFAGVLLHFIWNFSTFNRLAYFATYILFMVPVFVGWLLLAHWSRRMELKVLERHLPAYAAAGWIANWELPALCTFPGRKRARDWAKRTLGERGKRAMIDLQLAATELAFLREKASRGQDLHDFAHREQELLQLLSARKQVLQPAATQQPFGTAPVPVHPGGGPVPPSGPLAGGPAPYPQAAPGPYPQGSPWPPAPGPQRPPGHPPGIPPQQPPYPPGGQR